MSAASAGAGASNSTAFEDPSPFRIIPQRRVEHNDPGSFSKWRVLGSGAFGSIVSPSLPNFNKSGKAIVAPDPTRITKIFYEKDPYEKAVRNAALVREKIPSLSVPEHDYEHTYTMGNMAAFGSIEPRLKHEYKRSVKENSTDKSPLYMMSMPNLGVSCFHASHYEEVRNIPALLLFEQIIELLRTVQNIWSAGYIHGDIRETNVMIDLKTAKFTIIDFDWLFPFSEFYKKYPIAFYAHPPENLLLIDKIIINDNSKIWLEGLLEMDDEDRKKYIPILAGRYSKIVYGAGQVIPVGQEEIEILTNVFYRYITSKTGGKPMTDKLEQQRIYNELVDISAPTLDPYGAAEAINYLLHDAWRPGREKYLTKAGVRYTAEEILQFLRTRQILSRVLNGLQNLDFEKRLHINEAISLISAAVENIYKAPLSPTSPTSPASAISRMFATTSLSPAIPLAAQSSKPGSRPGSRLGSRPGFMSPVRARRLSGIHLSVPPLAQAHEPTPPRPKRLAPTSPGSSNHSSPSQPPPALRRRRNTPTPNTTGGRRRRHHTRRRHVVPL